MGPRELQFLQMVADFDNYAMKNPGLFPKVPPAGIESSSSSGSDPPSPEAEVGDLRKFARKTSGAFAAATAKLGTRSSSKAHAPPPSAPTTGTFRRLKRLISLRPSAMDFHREATNQALLRSGQDAAADPPRDARDVGVKSGETAQSLLTDVPADGTTLVIKKTRQAEASSSGLGAEDE